MSSSRKPRVAFVVQRAGRDVVGGAESLCLEVAQHMTAHWETEVLTTCARDYVSWKNEFAEGVEDAGTTRIRRFRVDKRRDVALFDKLSGELVAAGKNATADAQENWMRVQGPVSSGLLKYLKTAHGYDAFIFFGYLYATTFFGLPLVKDRALLAPLAHDEWPIHFPMWDEFFQLPRGFIFQTPEERDFLSRRFPEVTFSGPIAAKGVDVPRTIDNLHFRERHQIHEPFLLYSGRIDISKGCADMFEMFLRLRAAGISQHRLVLIGPAMMSIPQHPDILHLGIVDDVDKFSVLAACDWLVAPSPHESLSIALLEAWSVARPALVNAKSDVLVGQCRRSNGGLWYESFEDCAAILRNVNAATRDKLGLQGQRYVRENYTWQRVEADYLAAMDSLERA